MMPKTNPQIWWESTTKTQISIPTTSAATSKVKEASLPAPSMTSKLVPSLPTSDFFLTTMTIVKTVIGSGILTIPFTMSKMGYVFGIIIFIIAGLMSQYGAVMLLKAKNLSHHSNLSTIFYEIWRSKIAKSIGSLAIFLGNLGVCNLITMFRYSLDDHIQGIYQQNFRRCARKRSLNIGWFLYSSLVHCAGHGCSINPAYFGVQNVKTKIYGLGWSHRYMHFHAYLRHFLYIVCSRRKYWE